MQQKQTHTHTHTSPHLASQQLVRFTLRQKSQRSIEGKRRKSPSPPEPDAQTASIWTEERSRAGARAADGEALVIALIATGGASSLLRQPPAAAPARRYSGEAERPRGGGNRKTAP